MLAVSVPAPSVEIIPESEENVVLICTALSKKVPSLSSWALVLLKNRPPKVSSVIFPPPASLKDTAVRFPLPSDEIFGSVTAVLSPPI